MRPPAARDVPLLIAHRGGSGLAPENTLAAFSSAVERWGADMIELDVHATRDGECAVIHDATVDRTTDGTGRVADMTLDQLRSLDAGYRFTPDGGETFPFRDTGVVIPTLDEVLEALPATPITVEVKAGAAQAPLFRAVDRLAAHHRVVAAGMHDRDRTAFASYSGPVSASTEQLRRFYVRHRLFIGRFLPPPADVVQVPETWEGRRVVTPRFVRDLRSRHIPVHVWTVDDPADMRRLLDWGVAGIITDRPDILARVLQERTGRPPAGGHAGAAGGS
jgi:glycerophosphoryl diester phosphodiesterase